MATSGLTNFTLDITEIVEEAYERAGVDKQRLTADHTRSARRSMNLILQVWGNKNVRPWSLELCEFTTTQGVADEVLPDNIIDVLDAVLRRSDYEVPMKRISRTDYHLIPDKTIQGLPNRYFLHKDDFAPVFYMYNAPANSTDIVSYWAIRRLHDVTNATQNVDVPDRWLDPFCAELAYRLYCKRPRRERTLEEKATLKADARDAFDTALEEDRDRTPLSVQPDYGTYGI